MTAHSSEFIWASKQTSTNIPIRTQPIPSNSSIHLSFGFDDGYLQRRRGIVASFFFISASLSLRVEIIKKAPHKDIKDCLNRILHLRGSFMSALSIWIYRLCLPKYSRDAYSPPLSGLANSRISRIFPLGNTIEI